MSQAERAHDVELLENLASEDGLWRRISALGLPPRAEERLVLHQHLYQAEATTGARHIAEAYLAYLGYDPRARKQPPSASPLGDDLRELDTEVAYALLGEAFHWNLDEGEEVVTEDVARELVRIVREATDPWAILAFGNVEVPETRAGDLLGYGFHRVLADVGYEAGVILVGEQDIAMLWIVDDDGLTRGMDRGRRRARDRAYRSEAHRRGPPAPTEADRCRVCGLAPPSPPWGADGKSPSFEFCDCCGAQFGHDDATRAGVLDYRRRWLASGARWFRQQEKPADWSPAAQLSEVPGSFRDT